MNTCSVTPEQLLGDAWMDDPQSMQAYLRGLDEMDRIFPITDTPDCPSEDLSLIIH